jgi:hypothetical protein
MDTRSIMHCFLKFYILTRLLAVSQRSRMLVLLLCILVFYTAFSIIPGFF